MIFLACFIFGFSVIQLLVAITNLLFGQRFSGEKIDFDGLVSVLIPARNEEKNIANILNDLTYQDYLNIEVLVFNDQSADRTEAIVRDFSFHDKRIRLINSGGLPQGWLGKNFACHTLAGQAGGSFFLFLDADVRVSKDIIVNTTGHSLKHNLGLLSIFPMQVMETWGEKATVPVMNFILLSLLPLILVQKSKYPSLAVANGQFMLFDAEEYRSTLPHEKMKAEKTEDIKIARLFKERRLRVACLTGDETVRCRMYSGIREAVNGFSKNVTTFFGGSFLLAITFWVFTTLGFIPVFISGGIVPGTLYLLILLVTRVVVSIISKQPVFMNLVLWIPQQISLGLFIFRALINQSKGQYHWKGRNI